MKRDRNNFAKKNTAGENPLTKITHQWTSTAQATQVVLGDEFKDWGPRAQKKDGGHDYLSLEGQLKKLGLIAGDVAGTKSGLIKLNYFPNAIEAHPAIPLQPEATADVFNETPHFHPAALVFDSPDCKHFAKPSERSDGHAAAKPSSTLGRA